MAACTQPRVRPGHDGLLRPDGRTFLRRQLSRDSLGRVVLRRQRLLQLRQLRVLACRPGVRGPDRLFGLRRGRARGPRRARAIRAARAHEQDDRARQCRRRHRPARLLGGVSPEPVSALQRLLRLLARQRRGVLAGRHHPMAPAIAGGARHRRRGHRPRSVRRPRLSRRTTGRAVWRCGDARGPPVLLARARARAEPDLTGTGP